MRAHISMAEVAAGDARRWSTACFYRFHVVSSSSIDERCFGFRRQDVPLSEKPEYVVSETHGSSIEVYRVKEMSGELRPGDSVE